MFLQLVKGQAVPEADGAGCGATQCAQVRRRPLLASQVTGDAAYVGALGDRKRDAPRERLGRLDREQVRPKDLYVSRRDPDRLARAGAAIGALAIDRYGRERWWHLVVRSHEVPDDSFRALGRAQSPRDGSKARHLPLGVIGVRLGTKRDEGLIGLGLTAEQPHQARTLADAHHQHARGGGIERAGMPDPTLAQ